MTRKKPTISTASVVREYIDTHPSIKDGMQMGIINLSALARKIMDERAIWRC